MSSRRLLKAGEAIREVVSMAILTELRDPRVQNVTVTGVEVSPDMREAKVLVSIMGSEKQQQLSLRGLANSAGFLQSQIAKKIDTRYTPRLQFVLDDGVKKQLAVAKILNQIAMERKQAEQEKGGGEEASDDDWADEDDLASEEQTQQDHAADGPSRNQPHADSDRGDDLNDPDAPERSER